MESAHQILLKLVEETLCFEYDSGAITRVAHPHDTGWRCLPHLVCAQVQYKADLETEEGKWRVKPGQTICVKPWVRHRISLPKGEKGLSRWSHVQFWIFEGISIFGLIEPPLILKGRRSCKLGDIQEKLANLQAKPELSLAQLLQRRALAAEFLEMLTEAAEFRPEKVEMLQKARRLGPVLNHIRENLVGDLRREELAKLTGSSPSRFDVLFRTALGISSGLYVQGVRFQAARKWLTSSDLTVDEVGQRVGYGDAFHFSKIFKKQAGVSPKGYREKIRRGEGDGV